MVYLVELSDKRNIILLNMLKEKNTAEEFSFGRDGDYPTDSAIVFSPARKLTENEAAALPQVKTVYGGAQAKEVANALLNRGIAYVNIIENESYAVKNALLTAEAALAVVIGSTEKSVFSNNVLILGCGRVAKAVALLFRKTGIRVSVATFDKPEFDASAFYADKAYFGYGFSESIGDYDVIINTIPKMILSDAQLCRMLPETAIIELASVNCLDKESIGKYPIKYIPAGGLPMKYSAVSAAEIMLECLYSFN